MKSLPPIMLLLMIMVACNRSAEVDGTPFRNATWGMTIEEVQATEPDFDETTAVYSPTSGLTTVSWTARTSASAVPEIITQNPCVAPTRP